METVPSHAGTRLGSRPKPTIQDVQRVKEPFRRGDFSTPYEKLVLKIDGALQGGVGKVKVDKYLIIAKIINELKLSLVSDDGNDEICFIENAERFLKSQDSKIWLKNWFLEKHPARATEKTTIEASAETSAKATAKAPAKASGSGQGRQREATPTVSTQARASEGQSKQSQVPRSDKPKQLSPFGRGETRDRPNASNRPSPMHHDFVVTAHPRWRRASDSGIRPTMLCPNCGQPPQARMLVRVVLPLTLWDYTYRVIVIVLVLSYLLRRPT